VDDEREYAAALRREGKLGLNRRVEEDEKRRME